MLQNRLCELFEEFISECQYVRRRRPETIRGYRRSFEVFQKILPGVSLQLLTPLTVTNFFKTLHERKRVVGKGELRSGIKNSTQKSYWNKLGCFFSWLEAKKYIRENPLKQMRCPYPTYEDRKFLRKEELQKILSAIHHHSGSSLLFKRNMVIFYLLLFCGIRREELIFLKVNDIDFEKQVLTIRAETSKSGKSRQLPLHPALTFHLKEYLKERLHYLTEYLIISTQRDKQLTYDGLKHLITKLVKLSGIRFHLHQFRHTFAVNFLKTSRDLSKLKQLLGHSDIKMTAIYLRNIPVDEVRKDLENMSIENMM